MTDHTKLRFDAKCSVRMSSHIAVYSGRKEREYFMRENIFSRLFIKKFENGD